LDDGGFDDGGEDPGGWPDPVPPGRVDPGALGWAGQELTGTGGTDELNLDWAGVKYAFGETGTLDRTGDDACGPGAGFSAEEGAVATASARACGWTWPPGCGRLAPINAKAATAEAAISPPLRYTEATGREIRCRPGRPRVGRRAEALDGGAAAPVSAARSAGPGTAPAGRSLVWVKPLMMASASQPGSGCRAPTSASSSLAVGRSPGCLARQRATSQRSSLGTRPSSAGVLTSRYMSAALDPAPNGAFPVAANVSTAPKLNMSLAGPMSRPVTCSGDM